MFLFWQWSNIYLLYRIGLPSLQRSRGQPTFKKTKVIPEEFTTYQTSSDYIKLFHIVFYYYHVEKSNDSELRIIL